MGHTTTQFERLATINVELARKFKMNHRRLRAFAIREGIAIRWGGDARHPRLKVDPEVLKERLAGQVYVRPGATTRRQSRPAPKLDPRNGQPIHEDVVC